MTASPSTSAEVLPDREPPRADRRAPARWFAALAAAVCAVLLTQVDDSALRRFFALAVPLWLAAALPWRHASHGWWLPHAVAALPALILVFGWCPEACRRELRWTSLLGLPLAWVALMTQVAALGLSCLRQPRWPAAVAIGLALGGSAAAAVVLVHDQVWCGACIAIHLAMLVQAARVCRGDTPARWLIALATVLAALALPLLARGPAPREAWSPPPAFGPGAEVFGGLTPIAGLPGLGCWLLAGTVGVEEPPTPLTPAVPPVAVPADSVAWGSAEAVLVLDLVVDPACRGCQTEVVAVIEALRPSVAAGRVQVRFVLVYRDQRGQAVASLAAAAALAGGGGAAADLLQHGLPGLGRGQTLEVWFADLPEIAGAASALAALRESGEQVSRLLVAAETQAQALGATATPFLRLTERTGQTRWQASGRVNVAALMQAVGP